MMTAGLSANLVGHLEQEENFHVLVCVGWFALSCALNTTSKRSAWLGHQLI